MVTKLSDDTVLDALTRFCEERDTSIFTCKDLREHFHKSASWASFVVHFGEKRGYVERNGHKSNGSGPLAVLWRRV